MNVRYIKCLIKLIVQCLLVICVSDISTAQTLSPYRLKASNKVQSDLDELFSSYQLVEVQMNATPALKSADTPKEISLDIPLFGKVKSVRLEEYSLLSPEYFATIRSADTQTSLRNIDIKTYRNISGGLDARISIAEDYVYGYFNVDGKAFYIEPAYQIQEGLPSSVHVIYPHDKVVKSSERWQCASTEHTIQANKLSKELKSSGCGLVEIAIALDFLYVNKHGGQSGAINQSLSVLNMVAGDYENAFSKGIRFEVVSHFVSTCNTCDPWTASVDPGALLNSFTSWGPGGFGVPHDLGTIWTARNLCSGGNCGVAGLAWIGAVCSGYRYSLLEDFTSTAWALRVLTSHEMGHNFGADHDAGSGFIMAPSVGQNTSSWSTTSINSVNAYLPSYTCLSECIQGSCSEISNVSVSGCQPGSPSMYTLRLEISHAGGGGSSGFKVEVNGTENSFTWQTSPQVVVIQNLIADGTTNNTVRIRANDNSDVNCFGTATFDEPSSTCSTTMTYSFNDCALPQNWVSSSTNQYTWNSGDPLLQFEWRFDDATRYYYNYNTGANNATTKTIDGSCMAYFDDDIINHPLYTGTVTLSSPTVDLSLYNSGSLSFEYMFHAFKESPKPTNNSSFNVDVWNGTTWISILNDNTSKCTFASTWTTPCKDAFTADITAHLNPNFRIRFVYTDGGDGKWAGTIGLDNVALTAAVIGSNSGSSNCPSLTTINAGTVSGNFIASELVVTSGAVTLNGNTMMSANIIEINPGFTVGPNLELTIMADGCEPSQ